MKFITHIEHLQTPLSLSIYRRFTVRIEVEALPKLRAVGYLRTDASLKTKPL